MQAWNRSRKKQLEELRSSRTACLFGADPPPVIELSRGQSLHPQARSCPPPSLFLTKNKGPQQVGHDDGHNTRDCCCYNPAPMQHLGEYYCPSFLRIYQYINSTLVNIRYYHHYQNLVINIALINGLLSQCHPIHVRACCIPGTRKSTLPGSCPRILKAALGSR